MKVLLILLIVFFYRNEMYGQSKKFNKIQKIIDHSTKNNLIGVVVYIKMNDQPEWIGVSGYEDVANGIKLRLENIFSLGSIGKMYNAVAILTLCEERKLSLDDLIKKYLPKEIISHIPNGEVITIRHLLSHQSGLFNYENDPILNTLYVSGNLKLDTLSHLNALINHSFGNPSKFLPGIKFEYSSTNYVLLAMIMDSILPEDHTSYLRKLLVKHGYKHTFYRETPPQNITQHYGDLNKDSQIENLTQQTVETTNWFMGDDGVYAPIGEASHFLQDLMNGKILNKESLKQMMTWNNEKKPDYGLGLMADKSFPYKFLLGHSGRGIGTTTDLFYFPKQKMTVGIFCNTGIRQSSPNIKKEYLKMRNKIVKKLFLF
ncbi:MAG: serine hydrolase domain-containing protein [Chitinophagaceae bacterium]|nr:serine hydrolase domain-containing protein [Chitinophagaceae bacterium]